MAIDIESNALEKLLDIGHVVQFVGDSSNQWPDRYQNHFFRVERNQVLTRDRAFILDPDTSHDFALEDGDLSGLYPDQTTSLFEIVIGIKSTTGSMLVYPRYPATQFWGSLEKGGWEVQTGSETNRYISQIDESVSPFDQPTFRIHTVEDGPTIQLRLFNDGPTTDKIVLDMVVNRLHLPETVQESQLSQRERERARTILHPGLVARGDWS